MMGDNIVLRVSLQPDSVRAHAFTYWTDDMAYNGGIVTYESANGAEGFKRLDLLALNGNPDDWKRQIDRMALGWPMSWRKSQAVVCTSRQSELAATHPEVLTHLARFEGMAIETSRRGPTWESITYEIVAKRLRGLVRSGVRSWSQLLEVSK